MTVDITLTAPRRTRTSLGAHCRWPQRCAASAGITFARHDRSAGRAEIAKPGLRQPARGDRQRWRLAQPGIGAIRFADVDPEMAGTRRHVVPGRSEEHTSELQSLMRISYAVFCLTKKK